MAPKKVTKKPVVKKTTVSKPNPVEQLVQSRRNFFTSLQSRIQGLPGTSKLPMSISDEIRAYSRSQGSEKGMMKAVDCDVAQLDALLTFLLQAPNLSVNSLDILIQKFLASLVIREELGVEEDPISTMAYNERVVHKLRKYVKQHLSTFLVDLPHDAPKTDKPIQEVEKDLRQLFPVDNPFSILLEMPIPVFYIKSFLAQSDFTDNHGKIDVRRAVHQFIQDHRFHLLKDLLDEGFVPKSPHDWELVVGQEMFDSFPIQFWKHSTWQEFEKINENLKKHSVSVGDYFRLLHEKEETNKLIRVEEIKKAGKKKKLVVLEGGEKKGNEDQYLGISRNLLRLPNEKEMVVNLRLRSDLPGFVSHLISPVLDKKQSHWKGDVKSSVLKEEGGDFVGSAFNDEFFFPTDRFMLDRVQDASFNNNILTIVSHQYDPPREYRFHVAYLFQDGRVVHQNKKSFDEEQNYLQGQKGVKLPKLKQFLLDSPLEALNLEDVDNIRKKIRGDLSALLNQVYTKKMDTDTIASEIESCFLRARTLKEYLAMMSQVFFVIHPRYEFFSVFPEMKERLNLSLYNLSSFSSITLPLLFPRIETLDYDTQQVYFNWKYQVEEEFTQEMVMSLITNRYTFIRIPIPTLHHTVAPEVLRIKDRETNYLFLMPFEDTMLNLVEIAKAKKNDEILVDGKPLPDHIFDRLKHFMDLNRLKLGLGAFLEDTGFELAQEENLGLPLETPLVSVQPVASTEFTGLPGFKEKAFAYLDHLLSL